MPSNLRWKLISTAIKCESNGFDRHCHPGWSTSCTPCLCRRIRRCCEGRVSPRSVCVRRRLAGHLSGHRPSGHSWGQQEQQQQEAAEEAAGGRGTADRRRAAAATRLIRFGPHPQQLWQVFRSPTCIIPHGNNNNRRLSIPSLSAPWPSCRTFPGWMDVCVCVCGSLTINSHFLAKIQESAKQELSSRRHRDAAQ